MSTQRWELQRLDTVYWRIEFRELNHYFRANDFILNEDGSVYVLLMKWPNSIYASDVILVKIDNTGCLMDECHIGQPHFNTNGIVFPNPFTTEFNLQFTENVSEVNLTMYNAVGQLVVSSTLIPKPTAEGIYYVTYSAPTLANGLYFYQLTTNGNIITKGKIIKQ
ncbi:MAG: Secretion system C-terminal sorting domain [Bacteroidota bacterium]